MKHRRISGTIAYIGDHGGERGREFFDVTVHADGSRTLRATSEMDDTDILRDVVYTVDGAWQPVDAYVRLTVRGAFMGAGWFLFTDRQAEGEIFTAETGRMSQRITTDRRTPSFGAHPVVGDALHLGCFRGAKQEGSQTHPDVLMSSPLPNGASGPMLSPLALTAEYLGEEEITVPAGTFVTDHYRYVLPDDPDEHVWVIPEDYTLVRLRWDRLETTYELVEYRDSAT